MDEVGHVHEFLGIHRHQVHRFAHGVLLPGPVGQDQRLKTKIGIGTHGQGQGYWGVKGATQGVRTEQKGGLHMDTMFSRGCVFLPPSVANSVLSFLTTLSCYSHLLQPHAPPPLVCSQNSYLSFSVSLGGTSPETCLTFKLGLDSPPVSWAYLCHYIYHIEL